MTADTHTARLIGAVGAVLDHIEGRGRPLYPGDKLAVELRRAVDLATRRPTLGGQTVGTVPGSPADACLHKHGGPVAGLHEPDICPCPVCAAIRATG